jgi:hypothetical protein
MTLILVPNISFDIIDHNPWWDRHQIRKVIDDNGKVANQLKVCKAILKECKILDEPTLIDICLDFLPVKVSIESSFYHTHYTLLLPFPSMPNSYYFGPIVENIYDTKWPIKQVSANGTPHEKNSKIELNDQVWNIQDSTHFMSMSMMSSGWTFINWTTDNNSTCTILSDTQGRCRATYANLVNIGFPVHFDAKIGTNFNIINTDGTTRCFNQNSNADHVLRCETITDVDDPSPPGIWFQDHYFSNLRGIPNVVM